MKENRNEAIFREEIGMKRQPDNLSGIENKDKSKARLVSLGLSRIVDVKKHVISQGLLSPLVPTSCEQRQRSGWTGGEDQEIQSTGLS